MGFVIADELPSIMNAILYKRPIQKLDPWKLYIFFLSILFLNVRASMNCLRGRQQSPFNLFNLCKTIHCASGCCKLVILLK